MGDIAAFAGPAQARSEAKNRPKMALDKTSETGRVPPSDMKNNPLITILLGLLTISALASLVFCWLWMSNVRMHRDLAQKMAVINNNRGVINALASETVEYSKKHKDMEPILESVGLKSATNAPAAPTPKPVTK